MAEIIQIKNTSKTVIAEIASNETQLVVKNADLLPKDVLHILTQLATINADLPAANRTQPISRLVFRDCKRSVSNNPSPGIVADSKDCGINSLTFEGTEDTLGILEIISFIIKSTGVGINKNTGFPVKISDLKSLTVNCHALQDSHWDAIRSMRGNITRLDLRRMDIDNGDIVKLTGILDNSMIVHFAIKEGNDLPPATQQSLINILAKNSKDNESRKTIVKPNVSLAYPTRILTDLTGNLPTELPQLNGSTFPIDLLDEILVLTDYKFPAKPALSAVLTTLKKTNPRALVLLNDLSPVPLQELLSSFLGSTTEEIWLSKIKPEGKTNLFTEASSYLSNYPRLKLLNLDYVNLSGGEMQNHKYCNGPNLGLIVSRQRSGRKAEPSLETLNLRNCSLSDIDIANADSRSMALTHVACASTLRKIDLSGNIGITEDSLLSLMRWAADSHISEINVDSTGISAEGAAELNNLLELRQGRPDPFQLLTKARSFIERAKRGDWEFVRS